MLLINAKADPARRKSASLLPVWLYFVLFASVASLSCAPGVSAPTVQKPSQSFDIAFKEYRLKNGLRVLLAEDHSAPTFSICVTYNVGSRDERPGQLFRNAAVQPAGVGNFSRSGPHARAEYHAGQLRQSAPDGTGRAAPEL